MWKFAPNLLSDLSSVDVISLHSRFKKLAFSCCLDTFCRTLGLQINVCNGKPLYADLARVMLD